MPEEFRPLEGVRAVSLALNLPGPAAVARLAELGAQVIKIEPPTGDPLELAQSTAYAELHRGIDVRRADLKTDDGKKALDRILEDSDVLLTSSRLSALDRLGLGWPGLGERFPRLSHVAIVGSASPLEHLPGHDLTYQAECGLVDEASMPRTTLADLAGAMEAVSACLGLLFQASRGRAKSRRVLVPLVDSARFFARTINWGLTVPGGILGGGLPQYNLYKAKEGSVAVAALEPHFWMRLQSEIGCEHATRADLEAFFLKRTAEQWQHWAAEKDLPIVAVRA